MKYLYRTLIILIGTFCFYACISKMIPQKNEHQPIVKEISDAKKLELNETQFVGKPLKDLLKEIKPEIKSAIGNPTNTSRLQTTFFIFYFVNNDDYNKLTFQKKGITKIKIFIKQDYEHLPTRELARPSNWTKEDEKAYENMTIAAIRVTMGDDAKEEDKK